MRRAYQQMMTTSSPRPTPSPSPNKRAVYINQEVTKRQVNTTFHSPYKNGRRDPAFVNPSLVSSHLLYPQDIVRSQQSSFKITQNYVPTPGDREKILLRTMRQTGIQRSVTPDQSRKSRSPIQPSQQTTNHDGS